MLNTQCTIAEVFFLRDIVRGLRGVKITETSSFTQSSQISVESSDSSTREYIEYELNKFRSIQKNMNNIFILPSAYNGIEKPVINYVMGNSDYLYKKDGNNESC